MALVTITARGFRATVLEQTEHLKAFVTGPGLGGTTNKESSLLKTAIRICVVADP